jgi:copper(I)-binding protein
VRIRPRRTPAQTGVLNRRTGKAPLPGTPTPSDRAFWRHGGISTLFGVKIRSNQASPIRKPACRGHPPEFRFDGISWGLLSDPTGNILEHGRPDRQKLASARAADDSAVYMVFDATGDRPDRLLAAETAAAERVELRTDWLEGCFVHSRPVPAIELASGKRTALDPGGPHLRLLGLRQKLVAGATVALRLTFEHAGTVDVAVPVRERPGGVSAVRLGVLGR